MPRKIRGKCTEDSDSMRAAKREVCRAIRAAIKYRQQPNYRLAKFCGTSASVFSRATRYRSAEKISFNQLFGILAQLQPIFHIMIRAQI